MKFLMFLSIAFAILFSVNVYANADVCLRSASITECGPGTLDQLHVTGKARLSGTKVRGDAHIAGILDASDVSLSTLHVAGKAELLNSTIEGSTDISGLMRSCGNQFQKSIKIASDSVYLENTKTNSIEINPGGYNQTIYISNKSLVNGSITFTSNHGSVVIDSSSRINGHVIGGKIIKKEFQQICDASKNMRL